MNPSDTKASPMHGREVTGIDGKRVELSDLFGGILPLKPEPDLILISHVIAGKASLLTARIADGVDVNASDPNGMTALHHAAARGARPCIRVLVASKKCDFLARDNWGRTPSDLAIEWGRDFAVARLLTKHQMKQARDRGVPPVVVDP